MASGTVHAREQQRRATRIRATAIRLLANSGALTLGRNIDALGVGVKQDAVCIERLLMMDDIRGETVIDVEQMPRDLRWPAPTLWNGPNKGPDERRKGPDERRKAPRSGLERGCEITG